MGNSDAVDEQQEGGEGQSLRLLFATPEKFPEDVILPFLVRVKALVQV